MPMAVTDNGLISQDQNDNSLWSREYAYVMSSAGFENEIKKVITQYTQLRGGGGLAERSVR